MKNVNKQIRASLATISAIVGCFVSFFAFIPLGQGWGLQFNILCATIILFGFICRTTVDVTENNGRFLKDLMSVVSLVLCLAAAMLIVNNWFAMRQP
jgi:hypothetical protein